MAIAAAGALTFGWLFTGTYPWLAVGVTAVDWFVVNLLNRVVDLEEDRANGIAGTGFVARHLRALVALGAGVLLVSLVAVHLLAPAMTALRIAFHALGFAYNWRLLPGRVRLKELYFAKNTASAVGFLLTVFGLPLAAAGWSLEGSPADVTWPTVVVAATFFFLFELSYEVIYDLRDAPGDAAAGVRTYPVVHGSAAAVRIIDALITASLVALAAGAMGGVAPLRLVIMGAAPLVQLALYKRFVRRGITSADCVAITWLGAALLVTWNLWIVAELPGAML